MADEHTGLGQLISTDKSRDAVHIAIAPVRALEKLYPGQTIGLVRGSREVVQAATGDRVSGIVDPFLSGPVYQDQRFWMWMVPGSITSLRHEWTHKAFDGPLVIEKTKETSEAWLRDFIERSDCPDYETVIAAATGNHAQNEGDDADYCNSRIDGEYLHFGGRDAHGEIPPEFWDHVETVTGRKLTERPAYFSCSC